MYVRERSGISTRGGETGPKDARTRERPEEVERESGGGQGRAEVRRVGARGSVMRRQQQQQQVADTPSLLTRAVGSVMKLLRLAEFEILFVLFFIITFLLFKDLNFYGWPWMSSCCIQAIWANFGFYLRLNSNILDCQTCIQSIIVSKAVRRAGSTLLRHSMFKNIFQSGLPSIFFSLGSKPQQIWDTEAQYLVSQWGSGVLHFLFGFIAQLMPILG